MFFINTGSYAHQHPIVEYLKMLQKKINSNNLTVIFQDGKVYFSAFCFQFSPKQEIDFTRLVQAPNPERRLT